MGNIVKHHGCTEAEPGAIQLVQAEVAALIQVRDAARSSHSLDSHKGSPAHEVRGGAVGPVDAAGAPVQRDSMGCESVGGEGGGRGRMS
jgi:hypothetical protein